MHRGEPLFVVRRGERVAHFAAPVTGQVVRVNASLKDRPSPIGESPYDRGWICLVEPSDLPEDLAELRI